MEVAQVVQRSRIPLGGPRVQLGARVDHVGIVIGTERGVGRRRGVDRDGPGACGIAEPPLVERQRNSGVGTFGTHEQVRNAVGACTELDAFGLLDTGNRRAGVDHRALGQPTDLVPILRSVRPVTRCEHVDAAVRRGGEPKSIELVGVLNRLCSCRGVREDERLLHTVRRDLEDDIRPRHEIVICRRISVDGRSASLGTSDSPRERPTARVRDRREDSRTAAIGERHREVTSRVLPAGRGRSGHSASQRGVDALEMAGRRAPEVLRTLGDVCSVGPVRIVKHGRVGLALGYVLCRRPRVEARLERLPGLGRRFDRGHLYATRRRNYWRRRNWSEDGFRGSRRNFSGDRRRRRVGQRSVSSTGKPNRIRIRSRWLVRRLGVGCRRRRIERRRRRHRLRPADVGIRCRGRDRSPAGATFCAPAGIHAAISPAVVTVATTTQRRDRVCRLPSLACLIGPRSGIR